MNSLRVSVWLRRIVVCTGFLFCWAAVAWAQDSGSKAVEEARQKRMRAEIEEKRAILLSRHELERKELDLEEELLQEERNLEDKQKILDKMRESISDIEQQTTRKARPAVNRRPRVSPSSRTARSRVASDIDMLPSSDEGAEIRTDDWPDDDTQASRDDSTLRTSDISDDDTTLVASAPAVDRLENAYLDRKIHVLLYANVNDKPVGGIGPGARQNQKFLETLFESQFPGRLKRLIKNESFTRDSFASDLAKLEVGETDAVFIYVSTHGGFADNGEHYMSASGSDQISIRRNNIVSALKNKCNNPDNLRVLITDSCGSFIGRAPRFGIEAAVTPTHELFRLMMTTRGEVNVNAAAPRTEALYYSQMGNSGGGIFTKAFVYLSIYGSLQSKSTGKASDWLPFFQQVSNLSQDSTARQPPACWFEPSGRVIKL